MLTMHRKVKGAAAPTTDIMQSSCYPLCPPGKLPPTGNTAMTLRIVQIESSIICEAKKLRAGSTLIVWTACVPIPVTAPREQ